MPRNAKGRRRSKNRGHGGLSETRKKKLDAIGEQTEEETLEGLLSDFDIQTDMAIKQAKRTYIAMAKKALQVLPQKSAFPKEILQMPASEFKLRGGTLAAVMESLKLEKQGVVSGCTTELGHKSGMDNLGKENDPTHSVDTQQFVTPAMNTRSQALTGATSTKGQLTAKRMPKPLERVTMVTCSTSTGSPLDERTFLQLQVDQAIEDMKAQLLDHTSTFPQKYRSQLMKTLKTCKANVISQEQELLTPALNR